MRRNHVTGRDVALLAHPGLLLLVVAVVVLRLQGGRRLRVMMRDAREVEEGWVPGVTW